MENQTPTPAPTTTVEWTSTKAYALGAICLVLGIVLGVLFHGPTRSSAISALSIAGEQQMPPSGAQMPPQSPVGMSQAMPPVADPVFEKVKADPNNFDLLSQAGAAAMKAGTPKLAVDYYGRALHVKENIEVRVNLGNACFRSGDADQALQEFATVLKADPKNDKALYNTGVVRMVAKKDAKGAIASWQIFLKFHPDHPHKAQVQGMIERAKKAELKS